MHPAVIFKSQWSLAMAEYEAQGMSERDAFLRAVTDQAESMGLDFLGGALSGGVMAGGSIAINSAVEAGITNRQAEQILESPAMLDVLEETAGLELTEDMSKAQKRAAVKRAMAALAGEPSSTPAGGQEQAQVPVQTQPVSTDGAPELFQGREIGLDEFGPSGRKALTALYEREQDTAGYYGGFATWYQAGVRGTPMEQVEGPYAAGVNAAQRYGAYEAGRNDTEASLAEQKRAAEFAPVAGKDAGLVYDSYVRENVDNRTFRRVNEVAKALGVRVRFADSADGAFSNGNIQGSEILLEKGMTDPVLQVVGHEWTHRMQDLAPEQYRAFRDAVAGELVRETEDQIELHHQYGMEISYDRAVDEAVADHAGKLLADGKLLDRFIEAHRTERSLLEKVRDALRAVIRKLTGAEKRQVQTAEDKLTAALEAAAKQAEKLTAQENKNAAQAGGEVRYSIKYDSKGAIAVLEKKVDSERKAVLAYLQGLVSDDIFEVVLSDAQAVYIGKDLPGEYTQSEYTKGLLDNLKTPKYKAAYILDDMLLIAENGVWSEDRGGKHGKKAKNGWYYYDSRFAVPVYNVRGETLRYNAYAARLLVRNDADGKSYLYDIKIQKERSAIAANGFTEPTINGSRVPSDKESVPQSGENVNRKFSVEEDSEGRKLTEEQAEFFKDSKVVDGQGRLLEMYHGTTAHGEITKFRRGKTGWLGSGIYLTSERSEAQRYADKMGPGGGQVYSLYANITNPLMVTSGNPVPEILRAAYGRDGVYEARKKEQGNDTYIITSADIKKLQTKGYDGIMWTFGKNTEVSAFSPEQLKRVDNTFPTTNPDIRYSLKEDSEAFRRNIAAWDREGQPAGERFILGSTGPVLQGLGAIESDIYMEGDKISAIMEDHPEMTLTEIQRIPELLDDPVLVMKSQGGSRTGQNTRLVIFGSVKAKNGQPILSVLDLRPVEGRLVVNDMQKVNSSYTRDNALNYIRGGEILHADKKRTAPLLRTIGLHGPIELQQSGSIGSISYNKQNVNIQGVPFSDVIKEGGTGTDRYSLKGGELAEDMAALRRENARLQAQVERWKAQTQLSGGPALRTEDVTRLAGRLIERYSSTLKARDIAGELNELWKLMNEPTAGYREVKAAAEPIAQRL